MHIKFDKNRLWLETLNLMACCEHWFVLVSAVSCMSNVFLVNFIEMAKVNHQSGREEQRPTVRLLSI